MNRFENYRKSCPVCLNKVNFSLIETVKMSIPEEYRLPQEYNIVRCNKCGFVYADTSATKEDYDYYYSNFNSYTWGYGSFEYNKMKFEKIKNLIHDKSLKIVNIGSGSGWLEKMLFDDGYINITAFDMTEETLNNIKKDLPKLKTMLGSIHNKNMIEDKKFDVLIILSVLEHLLDINSVMESIKTYLKHGGLVIVEVPDYSKINKSKFPIANHFNREHINYFSSISLDNIFARHGFTNKTYDFLSYSSKLGEEYSILNSYSFLSVDTLTSSSINSYFKEENLRKLKRKTIIDNLILKNCNVIVWGTGSYLVSLYAETDISKLNIRCFFDNNRSKADEVLFGIPIKIPSAQFIEKGDVIVIISMLYSEQIIEQIRYDLKLDNDIIVLE